MILLAAFTLYPLGRAVIYSFQDFSPLNPGDATWAGISQYVAALSDGVFIRSALNTALLVAICVPIQTALAVILAVLLNGRLRFRAVFRAIYFIPYITAPVAVGAIMVYLFGPKGMVTTFLHSVLGTPDAPWYATTPYAFFLIAFIIVWAQVGFFSVIFLSGLQAIPAEIREAAMLDGAGFWRQLLSVTLPMLRPTLVLVLVIGTIVTLQIFDQPYLLSSTGGAIPGSPADSTMTLVMYVYTEAFRYGHLGQSAAAALLIVGLVVLFSGAQALIQRRTPKPS